MTTLHVMHPSTHLTYLRSFSVPREWVHPGGKKENNKF